MYIFTAWTFKLVWWVFRSKSWKPIILSDKSLAAAVVVYPIRLKWKILDKTWAGGYDMYVNFDTISSKIY